jgi:4-amino-4-deoxy-L-arabinose transferase-like glycosyltransferase
VSFVRRHPWLLITALVIVNAFVRNASTPLWDQDEAAYAGFARRMIETGNWVVPEFMWSEPHRKPPFLFWSIAVSFKLFGVLASTPDHARHARHVRESLVARTASAG